MLLPDQYFAALAPAIWADAGKRAAVQAIYPIVQEQVSVAVWGKFTNKALFLWSIHLWALDVANSVNDAQGPLVMSKSGPDQEAQWASTTGGQALREDFPLTKWGLQYIALRRVAYGSRMFPSATPGPLQSSGGIPSPTPDSTIIGLFDGWAAIPYKQYAFVYTTLNGNVQLWTSLKPNDPPGPDGSPTNTTYPLADGQTDWSETSLPAALQYLNANKANA